MYMHVICLLCPLAVLGRSIVVYGSGAQSGKLIGCANIEPSLVAEEEIQISFPRNGINPGDLDRCSLTAYMILLQQQGMLLAVH